MTIRFTAVSTLALSFALATPCFAEAAAAVDALDAADQTIVINGERLPVSDAVKTPTPLRNTPQAIAIVSAEQIEQQSMRSIADVLRAVPGASPASGEGHRDQILLRGQNTTADFFVGGIRDDVQYYRGLYNLDRVEVLKGPNALLFGRGGGGGIVNRVAKTAEAKSFTRAAASADSHGAWSASADANIGLGGNVGVRVNGAYETFDSFRDHVGGRRIGVTPTLGWTPDDDTRVDVTYEYSRDRRTVDRGIPSLGGKPLDGARSDFFGDPQVNRMRFDAHVVDLAARRQLTNWLNWSVKGRAGTYDKFYANSLAATAVRPDATVGIEAYRSATRRDSYFLQNDFVAKLDTGALRHTLLAGAEVGFQRGRSDRQQGFFDAAGTIQRIYVPLASADDLPAITFRDSPVRRATDAKTRATAVGLYLQDQVEIGRHVELIGGLRHDWFTLDYADQMSPTRLKRTDRLWSPRLGLVVKPAADLSLYASWSKSFLPQSGDQFSSLTPDLAALEPERFLNREVGAKWSPWRGFDVTLAAYLLDRSNTRASDPVSGLTVLTGEQRSKGIEFTAGGRITDALSLHAAAALQDARITRTTSAAPEGRHVASVPRFTGSLWGRYDVTKRLGLGLGLLHSSKSYASISNAVVVPSWTRVDAAAFVGLTDKLELQLNLENALDEDYVALVHTDNNLNPGAPRTLRAALKLKL